MSPRSLVFALTSLLAACAERAPAAGEGRSEVSGATETPSEAEPRSAIEPRHTDEPALDPNTAPDTSDAGLREPSSEAEPITVASVPARADLPPPGCRVVAADSGGAHSCAVTDAGEVFCWGMNYLGQLGVAIAGDRCSQSSPERNLQLDCARSPRRVPGLAGVQEVALSTSASCARAAHGAVFCWGSDPSGFAGATSETCASPYASAPSHPQQLPCTHSPLRVPGLDDADQITGYGLHCALTSGGALQCWGRPRPSFELIPELRGLVQTGLGASRTAQGEVYGWRQYDRGAGAGVLENGCAPSLTETCPLAPVPVQLPWPASDLSVGYDHSCAASAGGQVACWGGNTAGQLGITAARACQSTHLCNDTAQIIPGLSGVQQVFAGHALSCAIRGPERALVCWGSLPSGPAAVPASPREISLPGPVRTLALGLGSPLIVLQDGRLYRWGIDDGSGNSALSRIDVCP